MLSRNKKTSRKKYNKSKSYMSRLFREEGKWIKCNVYIIHNINNENVYVSSVFSYGRWSAHLGYSNNKNRRKYKPRCKGGLKPISDEEIRNEVEKLMRENPFISSKQIAAKAGFSPYRLNRIYMYVRRRIL